MSLKDETWSELQLDIPQAALEVVCQVFFDHHCLGTHEEEIPGTPDPGMTRLHAYFSPEGGAPAAQALQRAWERIQLEIPEVGEFNLDVAPLAYGDWAEGWKKYFKPLRVGRRVIVAPTWEEVEEGADNLIVRIDPGIAFGTGYHETTQLCLTVLEDLLAASTETPLLDVGTGTGILAIATAKMGSPRVLGIDNDEDAVLSAQENIAVNQVQDTVKIRATPLQEVKGPWPLVVANILAEKLIGLAKPLAAQVAPGGTLLLSGILATQISQIEAVYGDTGLTLKETQSIPPASGKESDRWVLLRYVR